MAETFSIVQLDPGEHVVFGVALETSSTSFSLQGVQIGGATKETRKGITNRRVIIEVCTGGAMSVPNGDVKTVTLAREKQMGVEVLRIVSIVDAAGRTHSLGLGGIDPGHETRIQHMFPGATLATKKKGLLSFLGL